MDDKTCKMTHNDTRLDPRKNVHKQNTIDFNFDIHLYIPIRRFYQYIITYPLPTLHMFETVKLVLF